MHKMGLPCKTFTKQVDMKPVEQKELYDYMAADY